MRAGIALIGFGAIGRGLAVRLARDPAAPQVTTALVRPGRAATAGDGNDAGDLGRIAFVETLDAMLERRPSLVVECAGQAAVGQYGEAVLRAGIDMLVASTGALADDGLAARLRAAASEGGSQVEICAGAVGAIDVLAAARLAGLDAVTYASRKPAMAFVGTDAESRVDLSNLSVPRTLFEGPADAAARAFPKNANVAMTVALASLGPADTRVRIVADPAATANIHEIRARGAFGGFDLRLENDPLPDSPKTSFLTVLSLERAVRNRSTAFRI